MKKLLLATLLFSSSVAFADSFVAKDIRVEGVNNASKQRILSALPVKAGQTVTDNHISQIVRGLFVNGYKNVKAMRDGDSLVISVSEDPIISDISVKGNSAVPEDAIKQNLEANGFKAGERLNTEKLEAFRKGLEDHYQSVGRYNAKVETIITPQQDGRAEVKIAITENDVALLKELNFNGNNAFSSRKLRAQLELQEDSWWKFFGNKFDGSQFEKDLQTLRDFYLDQGYAKFQITGTDVKLSDNKEEARVTIDLNEGEKYTLKSARIVGNVAGLSKELSPLLSELYLNEPFRRSDVKAVEDLIKAKLGEYGYAMAQVNVSPDFNDTDHSMGLSFVVDAGNRYTVRQIRFEGNTVSADETLRQEMRQQEGTWLSSQLVELGKVRLDRTGFFETVENRFETVPNSPDQLDVVYKVKERNTGSINFGIGYGTESGFSYQAGIKQDNFLGMGSSISLNGSRNDYGTTLNLGYNEPYFTRDGVSLGGNLYYETYDNSDSSTASSYARTTYGGSLTLGFPVNENNAYYLGVGYAYNKMKNISPEYNRNLYRESMNFDNWQFKTQDFDFSFGWNYSSLNRGYFPTKGVKATLGGKVTIPGSDNKYYKINAEAVGYYPLNRDQTWVLSGKLAGSFADGFGGKRLPFYQNMSAGGIGSLRGFSYGAIGPHAIYWDNSTGDYTRVSTDIVGGNAMANASVELIFPVPFVEEKNQTSVRTSVFVDAASVWNTRWKAEDRATYPNLPDYSDPSKVRASAGLAFQWNSPIGPLIFSYAKPIKKYEKDEIEQFQFSIGGSF